MDFNKLFPDQSSVKVVLNGGKSELDEATVPFTIGFDKAIAEKNPTHVLVIDIPYKDYQSHNGSDPFDSVYVRRGGERNIYELSKIDFIQFHKSGKHNLVFILLANPDKEDLKFFLKKERISSVVYENIINQQTIELNNSVVIGYCEELIEIPKEFFAPKPENKFKIWWHELVNRWHEYPTVDQCAFRKRVPMVFLIIPKWILGFIFRFVTTLVCNIPLLVAVIPCFIFGAQMKKVMFIEIFQFNWDFVFMHPRQTWRKVFLPINLVFDEDYYNDNRCYKFGKKEIKTPISLGGLMIQGILWYLFCITFYRTFTYGGYWASFGAFVLSLIAGTLAILHLFELVIKYGPIKKTRVWYKNLEEGLIGGSVIVVFLLEFLALNIFQIVYHFDTVSKATNNAVDFTISAYKIILFVIAICLFFWKIKFIWRKFVFVLKWFFGGLWRIFVSILEWGFNSIWSLFPEKKVLVKQPVNNSKPVYSRTDWLKQNMSIENLPQKVEFDNLIAPTKSETLYLKFKTVFWRTKIKVCKPYEK